MTLDAATWPVLEELERADELHELEHARRDAVAAPVPEELPELDLTAATALGRRVRITADAIRTLGLGELGQVSRLTGLGIDDLGRHMSGPRGPEITLAIAYVLALRLEPGATWEDAQRWRIEVVAPSPGDPTAPRPSS